MFDLEDLKKYFNIDKWLQWFIYLYINIIIYVKEFYYWILSILPKRWKKIEEPPPNTCILWKENNGDLTEFNFQAKNIIDVENKIKNMGLPAVVIYDNGEYQLVRNWDGQIKTEFQFDISDKKIDEFSLIQLANKNNDENDNSNIQYQLKLSKNVFYVGNEILSYLHVAKLFYKQYPNQKLPNNYILTIIEDDVDVTHELNENQYIKINEDGNCEIINF